MIFKSKVFDQTEKERHLKLEMAVNFSDYDLVMNYACEASDCSQQAKERLWAEYIKGGDKYFKSLSHFKASVQNFYNIEDEEQCSYFGSKFFKAVDSVFSLQHRDYAEAFFTSLSPAFMGQEASLNDFREALKRAEKSDNTHYINLLKEEIEKMEDAVEIKRVPNFIRAK